MPGSGTLMPLLAAACTAGVLSYLLPRGQQSRMAGALKGFTGLCVLLILLQPVCAGLGLLRDAADDPDALGDKLSELVPPVSEAEGESLLSERIGAGTRAELEAWVTQQLNDVFGIPPENCRVTVEVGIGLPAEDGSELTARVNRVWIQLTGRAVTVNPHAIESYFARELACECAVSVGGE